jgi:long-subunit fatty acid transport protein
LNGSTLIQDTNDWQDANAFRFGVTYQLLDQTQLRFGYSYDETAQNDAHFSARAPDNDRNLFSIGVSHRLDDGWQLEAGYMYVMFNDRNYSGTRPLRGRRGHQRYHRDRRRLRGQRQPIRHRDQQDLRRLLKPLRRFPQMRGAVAQR